MHGAVVMRRVHLTQVAQENKRSGVTEKRLRPGNEVKRKADYPSSDVRVAYRTRV